MNTIITVCVLIAILFAVGLVWVRHTKFGKRVWLRAKGTADEALNQDASTPEGAKAYYNAAIEEKSDALTKARALLAQQTGKEEIYGKQLHDLKKERVRMTNRARQFAQQNQDEDARDCLVMANNYKEQIDIIEKALTELADNITIQRESVEALEDEIVKLKAERDKVILTYETSQAIMALQVDDGIATTESEKMLEKVREGAQKVQEAAIGHKKAYENSGSVKQRAQDKRAQAADIEAQLQALKNGN